MARIKLGELLVKAGAIDELQLQAALGEQKKWGRPLGRTLVEMRIIDEKTLVAALSRQLNIPAVDLDVVQIGEEVLRYLKKDFCVENACIPFRHVSRGNFLDVAMSDPTNPELFDRIRVATRCNVRPYLAGPFSLDGAIRRHYLGDASSGRSDNRPWVASRPDESLFDLSGNVSMRTGEVRITPATEELELMVQPPPRAGGAPSRHPPQSPREPLSAPAAAPPPQLSRLIQEVERLSSEVADLTALLERDEKVIRKLMALLVEKGICSKQELLARIS